MDFSIIMIVIIIIAFSIVKGYKLYLISKRKESLYEYYEHLQEVFDMALAEHNIINNARLILSDHVNLVKDEAAQKIYKIVTKDDQYNKSLYDIEKYSYKDIYSVEFRDTTSYLNIAKVFLNGYYLGKVHYNRKTIFDILSVKKTPVDVFFEGIIHVNHTSTLARKFFQASAAILFLLYVLSSFIPSWHVPIGVDPNWQVYLGLFCSWVLVLVISSFFPL